MRKIAIFTAILLMAVIPAYSQAYSFAAIQQDAVGTALGGSEIGSSGTFAAFGNTSLVPLNKEKISMGTSYQNWAPSSFSFYNFGTSVLVDKNNRIGVSAAVSSGKGKPYEAMNEFGGPLGEFTPTELSLFGGVSGLITDNISVGASVGYLRQVLYDQVFNTTIAASAFMSVLVSDFTITFGGRTLGKGTPSAINLAGKWNKNFAENQNILLVADTNVYIEGNASISAGAQYTFMDILSLRAGYRLGGNSVIPSFGSLGAGVNIEGVHIDIVYLLSSGINTPGNSLILGLRFNL